MYIASKTCGYTKYYKETNCISVLIKKKEWMKKQLNLG